MLEVMRGLINGNLFLKPCVCIASSSPYIGPR